MKVTTKIPTKQKTGKAATKATAKPVTAKKPKPSSAEKKGQGDTRTLITKKLSEERKAKEANVNPITASDSPGPTKSPEEKARQYTTSEEKQAKELGLTTSDSEESRSEEDSEMDGEDEENEWDGVDDLKKMGTAPDNTKKTKNAKEPEGGGTTMSLEQVWDVVGLKSAERDALHDLGIWQVGDIPLLDEAEVVTQKKYGSLRARCALVVMKQKLLENSTDEWRAEWNIKGMMASGPYSSQFNLLVKTKVAAEKATGASDKHDTPQKTFKLKEISINPEHEWAADRNRFLNAIAGDSRNVELADLLEKGDYEKAKELEKKDGSDYQRRSLLQYLRESCNCQTYRPPTGNKHSFVDVFMELDQDYGSMGMKLVQLVKVLMEFFRLRLDEEYDIPAKFLQLGKDKLDELERIMEEVKKNFPGAEMSAWLIPLSLAYSVALPPYDKVCQDWLEETKTSKKLPTLDDARALLKSIGEVENHSKTTTKKTRKIATSGARRAGGQKIGGKATRSGKGKEQSKAKDASKAKPDAERREHSTAWTKHIARDDDVLTGKKWCDKDVWSDLHPWERRDLITKGQQLKKAERKAERDQLQAEMEVMRKSNLELKRKLEHIESRELRKEKARRSKSAFRTDLTAEFASDSE
mmetsp:Transcript_5682/g.8315  ORF Transcript_5682/g.8315 Transcript_5682/m.8315 type:complete len:639 (+) Transcript_5682:83-1999(+)